MPGTRSQSSASLGIAGSTPIVIPRVQRTFGAATRARQTLAIAWTSFVAIAKSGSGFALLAAIASVVVLFVSLVALYHMGVPLLPRTANVVRLLTAPIAGSSGTPWVLIPLLIIFYAGELVWRERDAGLSELADTTPVPESVLFLGTFLGLGLVLVMWMALLMLAGILIQVWSGYDDFELGVYVRILFGLQLVDYLLFALLVFVIHTVVNQKQVGYLVALLACGVMTFPSILGIEHNLFIYGSDPGWSYTDMRGFGPSLGPWLWFKSYWAAWALLLAVVARLFWVRGREMGVGARLRMARSRFTRPTAGVAVTAVALILTVGGFIFYNTSILNEYGTASARTDPRAAYERQRAHYEQGLPQPWLTATTLHVEIDPARRQVDIQGSYVLENRGTVAVDSIHMTTATAPDVRTGAVSFDGRVARAREDEERGHRIYALEPPLQPGDSVRVTFDVQFIPRGFRHSGVDYSVSATGAWFTNRDWLPTIGYQPPSPRPLADVSARRPGPGDEWIAFDAVIGTDIDQVAVAPGLLRGTWTNGGRRYYHYVADAPIQNQYAIASAGYAVREGQWNDVAIQIFHHPAHTTNLDRILRAVRASLGYYTEQFGPYPYRYIRFIERPGGGFGMHSEAANISYEEGFSILNPDGRPRGADLPFAGVAHEVAHQWWGTQLAYAHVEGAALLTESLAMYSAMQVVEKTEGDEHLRRFLRLLRTSSEIRVTRAGVPLLRATNWVDGYRKGPFALYALGKYVGQEQVNGALRRLLEQHGAGASTLPTSLDLFRELRDVTPDPLKPLLRDLFAANTIWDLETKQATAKQTPAGDWEVTLDVRAHKVTVDRAGVEKNVPMDDWVAVGVFAPAESGGGLGEPIYEQKHRIQSAGQTITVTVPRRPARAGIDPRQLLTYLETSDPLVEVKIER